MIAIECKRIEKANRQCDKTSRLEFVAIQFGVKFTVMYMLRHYVDRDCQLYLHCLQLFRKLCYFTKLSHNFILFYFILFYFSFLFVFKVILYYSLYGITTLGSHSESMKNLLLSYWLLRT